MRFGALTGSTIFHVIQYSFVVWYTVLMTSNKRTIAHLLFVILLVAVCLYLHSCGVVKTTYKVTKGTVKVAYNVTKFAGKTVYTVGKFSFKVVVAPLTWPLAQKDIESIDDLPPKEAIKKGRVKTSPYVVKGKRYVPMNVKQAETYRQRGIASWYGYETYRQKGGRMTANGEAFDPRGLNAAHKYLPLPTFVWVTNLENNRRIALRVNDRGPFVKGRIIDLSAGNWVFIKKERHGYW